MDLESGLRRHHPEKEVFLDAYEYATPSGVTTNHHPYHHKLDSSRSHRTAANMTSSGIRFRPIRATDLEAIRSLHEEWFPVRYHEEFYESLCCEQKMCHTGDDLYTELAVLPHSQKPTATAAARLPQHLSQHLPQQHSCSSSSTSSSSSHSSSSSPMPAHPTPPSRLPWAQATALACAPDALPEDNEIVACIVAAPISASKLNPSSRKLLLPEYHHYRERLRLHMPDESPPRHSRLCYIMTLGTVRAYRQEGLATSLVERCIDQVVAPDPSCGALYLHVITSNTQAIRFYEGLGFWRVEEIPDYYTIDGEHHNCYLYAKYFHGNHGHLDLLTLLSAFPAAAWQRLKGVLFRLLRSTYQSYYSAPTLRAPSRTATPIG